MEETSRQIPHPAGRLSGSRVRRGRPLPSLRQVLDSDVGVTIGQAYQVEKVIGAVKAVKVSSGLGNRKLLTAKEIRALVDGCDPGLRLMRFLVSTGCRISEALGTSWTSTSSVKSRKARAVNCRRELVEEIHAHFRGRAV